jgi:hypothetical protein
MHVCSARCSLAMNHLSNYGEDLRGVKALADAVRVNGSLTSIDLSNNCLMLETSWVRPSKVTGEKKVGATVTYEGSKMVISQIYNDGHVKMIDTACATELASAIASSSSLARLDVHGNALGEVGEAAILEAVEGRDGFVLVL